MPIINLTTEINAPIEICFDLSRSIDLHVISTAKTNEKAIAGITKGLININETVTWQATNFGIKQKLTSKIIAFDRPTFFVDTQIKGIFKSMIHHHKFEQIEDNTIMVDIFEYQSPLGFLGKFIDKIILTGYLKQLLIDRNRTIKEFAESEKWKLVLSSN